MSSPSARLAELGLVLPAVPAPVASYVPAVRHGDLVFSSGQLPMVDGALGVTGKVGTSPGAVSGDVARDAARTCALNAVAAVAAEAGGIDAITAVVKVTGFVASEPGFGGQPAVVDGASELLGSVFGDGGRHARSAVGVAVLPLDAPVEIEIVVAVS
ncbi:RidA family protein [Georgenia alba]|uniref:RidA family protein n=1 Tax=Georgenia alba TaxID=2233858 RepID=A0ABW2QA12_9MICO